MFLAVAGGSLRHIQWLNEERNAGMYIHTVDGLNSSHPFLHS